MFVARSLNAQFADRRLARPYAVHACFNHSDCLSASAASCSTTADCGYGSVCDAGTCRPASTIFFVPELTPLYLGVGASNVMYAGARGSTGTRSALTFRAERAGESVRVAVREAVGVNVARHWLGARFVASSGDADFRFAQNPDEADAAWTYEQIPEPPTRISVDALLALGVGALAPFLFYEVVDGETYRGYLATGSGDAKRYLYARCLGGKFRLEAASPLESGTEYSSAALYFRGQFGSANAGSMCL